MPYLKSMSIDEFKAAALRYIETVGADSYVEMTIDALVESALLDLFGLMQDDLVSFLVEDQIDA